ncbi:MAG: ATP synthase F1 subunit gamma [Parcubacteria group bacterium]|nr:MAG: ATP synthase F1 subunit gamma [Parcubacteria group bacterium]
MPQATRDIRRRIKSVTSTRKITKAMELVAAAKMRKAVANVLATRAYSDLTWETVLRLVGIVGPEKHPFFKEKKKVKKVLVVMISTNRGLCGSFNFNLVQKVVASISLHHPENRETDIISFGARGRDEARGQGLNIVADFIKTDITQSAAEINPMAHLVTKEFLGGDYDKVFLAYTDFMSALRQVPHVKQLLPIVPQIDTRLGHISHEKNKAEIDLSQIPFITFEPSISELLDSFLPRLVEVQIFQAVLESEASEHSARMLAMKNASEAALEMVSDLTLAYNQARQSAITAEIAEIAAGSGTLSG